MTAQAHFHGKKILITGGTGFIGSHLSRRLLGQGAEIHSISRSVQNNRESGLRWWQGDLADIETVRHLLHSIKPDLIFHLASYVKGARELSNVLPTLRSNLVSQVNLMTVASEVGCDRFISTGSMEEPGLGNSQAVPGSPYAAAKWAASAYGRMFQALYQFPVIMLRVFMVYGPAQSDLSKLIPYVITSLLHGEAPKLSSGRRKVDWIYVDDVVDALLRVAQAPSIEGATIDIGTGSLVSIQTVVDLLVSLINPNIKPQFGALLDRPMEQEPIANTEDTYHSIGWRSKVSLEDGLRLTADWYQENLNKLESAN
jgi:UDP-glucose 4-epimerase